MEIYRFDNYFIQNPSKIVQGKGLAMFCSGISKSIQGDGEVLIENKAHLYVDVNTIKRCVVLLGIPLKVGRFEVAPIRMVGRFYCFLDSACFIIEF